MTLKIKQEVLMQNAIDGVSQKMYEGGAATVKVADQTLMVRRARLTLTAFQIAVLNANDYGGSKLLDLPDRNIMLLGCEVDCVVTKAGTTNGIVAATDITMGIGTATATASTLATTMIDVIEATAMTADTLAVDFEKHSNDQSTATFPKRIADGPTAALFMNITTGNITADDSVAVTGTIDIFYVDLGNLAS
jgi:hypothetical protein